MNARAAGSAKCVDVVDGRFRISLGRVPSTGNDAYSVTCVKRFTHFFVGASEQTWHDGFADLGVSAAMMIVWSVKANVTIRDECQ